MTDTIGPFKVQGSGFAECYGYQFYLHGEKFFSFSTFDLAKSCFEHAAQDFEEKMIKNPDLFHSIWMNRAGIGIHNSRYVWEWLFHQIDSVKLKIGPFPPQNHQDLKNLYEDNLFWESP